MSKTWNDDKCCYECVDRQWFGQFKCYATLEWEEDAYGNIILRGNQIGKGLIIATVIDSQEV